MLDVNDTNIRNFPQESKFIFAGETQIKAIKILLLKRNFAE
jgi:hypothetical protein